MNLRGLWARVKTRNEVSRRWWWWRMFDIDAGIPYTAEQREAIEHFLGDQDARAKIDHNLARLILIAEILPSIALWGLFWVGTAVLGWPWWTVLICIVCWLVAMGAGQYWVARRYYAPLVRREMRRHGHDVCIQCGYWLHGLDDEVKRCPECGAK